jgi:hypothetical protein
MNGLNRLRHPWFGHIVVLTAFWVLINIVFAAYTYLLFSSIETLLPLPGHFNFLAMLVGAAIMACVQGCCSVQQTILSISFSFC